jgi:hypothetical protein
MGVAVDSIDMASGWFAKEVLDDVTKPSVGSIIVRVPKMANGVEYLVNQLHRLVRPKNLWVLRIWGHGGVGMQLASAGEDATYDPDWGAGLSVFNFSGLEDKLETLRPLFISEKARIELRGCIAGFGAFGSQLMMKLANTCGCRVHASDEFQAGNNWRGQVWEANPYWSIRKVHGYDIYGGFTPNYMPATNGWSYY